jgi:antitoxin component of RelBE/YafQ-DinJ toxin-antitoxin module
MMSRKSNYALRLSESLKAEAERVAQADGTTLNQFINVAVAEKLAAMRTASFFAERRGRADRAKALEIIRRAGKAGQVREGDEVA